MHPMLRYLLFATPIAALIFLTLSAFFTGWEGHVVSFRPAAVEDPAVLTVLIVTDEGDGTEADWPADVVRDLNLRVDPTGTPPNKVPEDAATTLKSAFNLHFTVTPTEGGTVVVRTTSGRALSAAFVAWLLGIFLHNMWLSGSPFSFEPREHELPAPLASGSSSGGGQVAKAPPRSRKGPPPPRPRRGQGRRG